MVRRVPSTARTVSQRHSCSAAHARGHKGVGSNGGLVGQDGQPDALHTRRAGESVERRRVRYLDVFRVAGPDVGDVDADDGACMAVSQSRVPISRQQSVALAYTTAY
jgi:aminoglycoside phosphotransferase